MTERRYNEDEVALILRKAVDAGADDRATATGKGMSLSELKEIGIEVGIDAARIEDAARTLERRDDRPITGSVLGLPTTAQLDRVVPVRLVPEDLPQPLDAIRSEFARQGIVEKVLEGIEWRARSGMGGRYVSIRPEGDQARIRVPGNYRDRMMGMTLGAGLVVATGGRGTRGFAGRSRSIGHPADCARRRRTRDDRTLAIPVRARGTLGAPSAGRTRAAGAGVGTCRP